MQEHTCYREWGLLVFLILLNNQILVSMICFWLAKPKNTFWHCVPFDTVGSYQIRNFNCEIKDQALGIHRMANYPPVLRRPRPLRTSSTKRQHHPPHMKCMSWDRYKFYFTRFVLWSLLESFESLVGRTFFLIWFAHHSWYRFFLLASFFNFEHSCMIVSDFSD